MARNLKPTDAHLIMNLLVKEATGQDSTIQAVDTSSFVSAGETVLATGVENTLNALSIVIGRTLMAVRPYKAKLAIINALNTGEYTSRLRKISYYSREAQDAGDWNTIDASGSAYKNNLADGYDNGTNSGASTQSMWVQNQPIQLEMNFGGQSVWQESTTVYENQLKVAFRSESEFAEFVTGIMTEKGNDIESQKEAFNRMTLLNHIGACIDAEATLNNGMAVNLRTKFNAEMGTNYTVDELLGGHLTEFLQFLVAEIKTDSDYFENRSANYHWSPTKAGHVLLRHTPKSKQRLVMYSPLFTKSESRVFSEIFNPQYLSIENYEGVTYWQNINEPSKIDITPAIPDIAGNNGGLQKAGNRVQIGYVIGMLYDVDGLMTDFQFETAEATPLEARKRYRNIWWSFSKNAISDLTENARVYYIA